MTNPTNKTNEFLQKLADLLKEYDAEITVTERTGLGYGYADGIALYAYNYPKHEIDIEIDRTFIDAEVLKQFITEE